MRKLATLGLGIMLTLGALGAVEVGGCAGRTPPVVGSVNQFDSNAYLTLVTTDNIIQGCKRDLTAGVFPANIAEYVKPALNGLIQAYNVANVAYTGYHAAAVAGTVTVVQQTQVTNALNNVQTATTTLIAARGGN
jgi:hypothetical protein